MKSPNDKWTRDMWDEYNDYKDFEATEERLDKYNDKYMENINGLYKRSSTPDDCIG